MFRSNILNNINNNKFDVIIIGGGATGLGCAVESITRGYSTLLVEAMDYAKATSSRSTKLLHGGVRYLAKGDINLVKTALKERYYVLQNAPHLSKEGSFIIPCYNSLRIPYYYTGLKFYDLLAGSLNLTKSKKLTKTEVIEKIPNVNSNKLKGGIQYSDGIFDDSRMAITLLKTFLFNGGVACNYLKVTSFIKEKQKICGVELTNNINNEKLVAYSNCVINATGIFTDEIRKLDNAEAFSVIKWAQGIHLVIDKENFAGKSSLLVPKTKDGRVLFFVPWYNKVLCGTTDTLVKKAVYEPKPLVEEIKFILDTANEFINNKITNKTISSVYAGIRPLVMDGNTNTSKIVRDDKKFISNSGLITITGGKWTTYRKMAETTIDFAIKNNMLTNTISKTKDLKLFGYMPNYEVKNLPENLKTYGSEYYKLRSMDSFKNTLSFTLNFTEAQVEYAIKHEQAQTVDDVLSRRTRSLLLDSQEAIKIAPQVAQIMAKIMQKSAKWQEEQIANFNNIAKLYNIDNYSL